MIDDITYPVKYNNDPEIPLVVFLVYVVVSLLGILLMFHLVMALVSSQNTSENGAGSNTVTVSAVVLPTIGFKIIPGDQNSGVSIAGNYPHGFVIANSNTGNLIYETDSKPGSGVLVRLKNISQNINIVSKY